MWWGRGEGAQIGWSRTQVGKILLKKENTTTLLINIEFLGEKRKGWTESSILEIKH